jgi:hypothetical protein
MNNVLYKTKEDAMSWKSMLLSIVIIGSLGLATQALSQGDATTEAVPDAPVGVENVEPTPTPSPGDDPPPLALELPEPSAQCLTGWCSNDAQCEKWNGPGSMCIKHSGASCGQCISL